MEKDLIQYVEFVLNATTEVSYDGKILGWSWSWSFPNALLFTISIMTVIGGLNQKRIMHSHLHSFC